MSLVFLFLILLFAHWIADFVLQSHWMATNKATNNFALAYHVTVYSVIMIIAYWITGLAHYPILLFLFLFITHFATDYVSSRATKYYMSKRDLHTFFVVIGFDQFVHFVTLAIGMYL